MNPPCLWCGDPSEDRHHLTGRDGEGAYFDADFTAPLCHSDHELAHDDWNTLQAHDGAETDTCLDSLALGLKRTAAFVGRLADALPEPLTTFMALLAAFLARCAGQLSASIAALDEYSPGWRTIPGV